MIDRISAETLQRLERMAVEEEQAAGEWRLKAATDQRQADIAYKGALTCDTTAFEYRTLIAYATGEPLPRDAVSAPQRQAQLARTLVRLLADHPDLPPVEWVIDSDAAECKVRVWSTQHGPRLEQLTAWAHALHTTVEHDSSLSGERRDYYRVTATVAGQTVTLTCEEAKPAPSEESDLLALPDRSSHS